METYPEWRASHPIRQWAYQHKVSLTQLAAKLGMSAQLLNEWMRQTPPYGVKFMDLCIIMDVKPDKLRAEIAAWRQKGEQLEL